MRDFEDGLTRLSGRVEGLLNSRHQLWNAALAVEVIRGIDGSVSIADVIGELVKVEIPGRSWLVDDEVYADIAHNPDKIEALLEHLNNRYPERSKIFVVAVSAGRSAKATLKPILRCAQTVIVTQGKFKGQDADVTACEISDSGVKVLLIPDPAEAVEVAKKLKKPGDLVVFTGSGYAIDEAFNPNAYLRHLNTTYGWRAEQDAEVNGRLSFNLPGQLFRNRR